MAGRLPSRGLYAITDSILIPPERLAQTVEAAILGGAVLIQYRDKMASWKERLERAAMLVKICHRHGVPLIVNDDPKLTLETGADGVHLGRDDGPYEEARELLGPEAVIGISCYNVLDNALAAQAMGADYAAFGRFFPSKTKPQAVEVTPSLLREARHRLKVPIVAIGGISPENGGKLIEAGADFLAVIGGVFGQADVRQAAARYARLFS